MRRKRRSKWPWLLILPLSVLVAMGILANARTGGPDVPGAGLVTRTPREQGGQLVYARDRDFDSLNPLHQADPSSWEMTVAVFEGLVVSGVGEGPRPALAQSWHRSGDGLSYTFRLKDGVRFHDGESLTARDVELTYYAFLHPSSSSFRRTCLEILRGVPGYTARLEQLRGQLANGDIDTADYERLASEAFEQLVEAGPVQALDDVTVRFHLEHAGTPFADTAADLPILPRGTQGETPVGTGPFVVAGYVPGEHLALEPNRSYHSRSPSLDTVVYLFIPGEQARIEALKSGEASLTAISPARADQLDPTRHALFVWPVPGYLSVALNLSDPLLSRHPVRRALTLAVDRVDLVERVFRGYGAPAAGPVSPGGSRAHALAQTWFDPYQATELLQSEGWVLLPSGDRHRRDEELEVTLLYADEHPWDQVASHVAWCWRQVGVRVIPEPVPRTEIWDRLLHRDFQAALVRWTASVDPGQHLLPAYGSDGPLNVTGYSSEQVDIWLAEALASGDRTGSAELYLKIGDTLAADAPHVFLVHEVACFAVEASIKGLRAHSGGPWALFYSLKDASIMPR